MCVMDSRVAVNQLWLRHFGGAIVPSVASFLDRHQHVIERSDGERFPAANPMVSVPAGNARERAPENLVHVLLNHNDFVTIR